MTFRSAFNGNKQVKVRKHPKHRPERLTEDPAEERMARRRRGLSEYRVPGVAVSGKPLAFDECWVSRGFVPDAAYQKWGKC